MSGDTLINPPWYRKMLSWILDHKRITATVVGAVLLIVLTAIGINKCSNWREQRAIDKARANVNAIGKQLANAQANAQADAIDVAVKTEQYKEAVNNVLVTANATAAQKANTNAALANLANTVAANVPVGTTADKIESQLKDLDQ